MRKNYTGCIFVADFQGFKCTRSPESEGQRPKRDQVNGSNSRKRRKIKRVKQQYQEFCRKKAFLRFPAASSIVSSVRIAVEQFPSIMLMLGNTNDYDPSRDRGTSKSYGLLCLERLDVGNPDIEKKYKKSA